MRSGPRDIVIVDLDSTLCDTRTRRHLSPLTNPANTWIDYSMGCATDTPINGAVELTRLLWDAGHEIHLVSGRNIEAHDPTVVWLIDNNVPHDVLRLKHGTDPTDNAVFKLGYILALLVAGRQVRLIVEDWPPLADFLEVESGVPVLCVNPRYGFTPPAEGDTIR